MSLHFITSNEDAETGNSQWRAFRVDVLYTGVNPAGDAGDTSPHRRLDLSAYSTSGVNASPRLGDEPPNAVGCGRGLKRIGGVL